MHARLQGIATCDWCEIKIVGFFVDDGQCGLGTLSSSYCGSSFLQFWVAVLGMFSSTTGRISGLEMVLSYFEYHEIHRIRTERDQIKEIIIAI